MSWKRKLAMFVAEKVAEGVLTSAAAKIGEAIGQRIGAKIYTPPEPAKPEDVAT